MTSPMLYFLDRDKLTLSIPSVAHLAFIGQFSLHKLPLLPENSYGYWGNISSHPALTSSSAISSRWALSGLLTNSHWQCGC